MQVDAPDADLAMPAGLLEAARNTWLDSCKKVRPGKTQQTSELQQEWETGTDHGSKCGSASGILSSQLPRPLTQALTCLHAGSIAHI